LQLKRSDFYEKELTFQVSCSYGPGRYDPAYEHEGHDYPVGFVRWTEQRNFEAVLDLMARGALDVAPLITHRFAVADAPRAYELLLNGNEPFLGILLEYSPLLQEPVSTLALTRAPGETRRDPAQPRLAVVGAGNYAARTLIPSLARTNARLVAIVSRGGLKGARLGRKYGFEEAVTDASRVISGANVNAVVIATRHDSHARFVREALGAGKHVFVEKPLAIVAEEVDAIETAWNALPLQARPLLMVGFNRRFAPHTVRVKSLLETMPVAKAFVVTVNAGILPANHWTLSATIGGGRIVGEGCHFIDLMRFLADAPIVTWHVTVMDDLHSGAGDDKVSINLKFADGSIGTLHYLGNGHRAFPKERIEIFCAGRVLQLDNFLRLRGYGWPGFRAMRLWRQDKGHVACSAAFVNAIRQGLAAPIPFDEIVEVARVSIAIGAVARGRGVGQGCA
jgi:predicted dehydrogenase